MKLPLPPPNLQDLMDQVQRDSPGKMATLISSVLSNSIARQKYIPWDKMISLKPPDGLTKREWWLVTKLARLSVRRTLPLLDKDGREFSFALPDEVLRAVEVVNSKASGNISISEQVTNPITRDTYVINSLIEEAITSSQLEGASTERGVAKEMIRTGRNPKTRSERMILNNYYAMRRVVELADQDLTPDLVCEIHGIVTDGTLDNPDSSGRFQSSDEQRVTVQDVEGNILHAPPPASELPERIQRLCEFANSSSETLYIPPVLRAVTIHFMIGYDHPFEDGNGRTARALFYWSMLRQGYWLTEFLAISKILRDGPAKYARSFLHTEQDDNDLTYFHIFHLGVYLRAVDNLHAYLAAKMTELRDFQKTLKTVPGEFNNRQVSLLNNAITHPGQRYTALSHARSHGVTSETARQDLAHLERRKLLVRGKQGKAFSWTPAPNLLEMLEGR